MFLSLEPVIGSNNGENTLPVVFDTTEDPNLNNLTRSDVNCDKKGTCYDGKFPTKIEVTERLIIKGLFQFRLTAKIRRLQSKLERINHSMEGFML